MTRTRIAPSFHAGACRGWALQSLLGLAIALISVGQPLPASAQTSEAAENSGQALETITVTARKREESFQDVPVAMQVLTAQDLKRYDTTNLTELSSLLTQVQLYPSSAGTGSTFVIRGISSSSLDPGVETSVSINADGMSLSRGRVINEADFDLDNVQVLKGPQALFFGQNSPAGVISLNSAGPGDHWEFITKAAYEFVDNQFTRDLVASGPITDTLGIRLAYHGDSATGWLTNDSQPQPIQPSLVLDPYPFPGAGNNTHLGADEQNSARLTLAYRPTDDFKVTLKAYGTNLWSNATAGLNENVHCTGPYPVSNGLVDTNGHCGVRDATSIGALPAQIAAAYPGAEVNSGAGYNYYNAFLSTLNMEYTAPSYKITSLTGLHKYNSVAFDNFDGTTWDQYSGRQFEASTDFSEEIRALSTFKSPVNVMIGAFYENAPIHQSANGALGSLGFDPTTGRSDDYANESDTSSLTYSAFGQLIWNITQDLEFDAGARWTHDNRRMTAEMTYRNPFISFLFLPVGEVLNPTLSESNTSPEATLTWKITPDQTIYGAYKTGYKPGGFSAQVFYGAGANNENVTFKSERADGGEVGYKSNLFNHRLQLEATAYRYYYHAIQDTVFNAATLSSTIFNADALSLGSELDAKFLVAQGFLLRGQVGYNDTHYVSFPNAPCYAAQTVAEGCHANTTGLGGPSMVQDLSGQVHEFAPPWTGSVGLSYDRSLVGTIKIGFDTDVILSSRYETQVQNEPFSQQSSSVRLNMAVRLYPEHGPWELAFMGQNLSNKYLLGATADKPGGAPGDVYGQVIRGRQLQLQGTYRF